MGLLTVKQILDNREKWLAHRMPPSTSAMALSTPGSASSSSVNTISTLPPAAILSVVSWNVQTFEAGKSRRSPYVNKVINRILEALNVDVCCLLETRENSYVNMNGIEAGECEEDASPQDMVVDDPDDEDEENDEIDDGAMDDRDGPVIEDQDEDMEPWVLSAEEQLAEQARLDQLEKEGDEYPDLIYTQMVSEMTGKLWRPPHQIFVYHNESTRKSGLLHKHELHARLTKKAAAAEDAKLQKQVAGSKKINFTKKEQATLTRLTKALAQWSAKEKDEVQQILANPNLKKHLGKYRYFPRIFKSLCVEADGSPSGRWEQYVTPYSEVLMHYYSAFLLDDTGEEALFDDEFFPEYNQRMLLKLNKCPGCNRELGLGSCSQCEQWGPYTHTLENLKGIVEGFVFYRGSCQESYSVLIRQHPALFLPSAYGQWLCDKQAVISPVAARLMSHAVTMGVLGSPSSPSRVLGFQDKDSSFYGRCPFTFPLLFRLPTQELVHMHWAVFHGPFGLSTLAGIEARKGAMTEVLLAPVSNRNKDTGALEFKALEDVECAMIAGDFNLDWAPDTEKRDGGQKIAQALYDAFKTVAFQALIPGGIKTSLISPYGNKTWMTKGPLTEDFTSSAYDNFFLKGNQAVKNHVVNAGVIDVIQWMADHIGEFPVPDTDKLFDDSASWSAKTQAFYLYHNYVSDHLPIIFDLAVAAMPANSDYYKQINSQAHTLSQMTRVTSYWTAGLESLELSSLTDACPEDKSFVIGRCEWNAPHLILFSQVADTHWIQVEIEPCETVVDPSTFHEQQVYAQVTRMVCKRSTSELIQATEASQVMGDEMS